MGTAQHDQRRESRQHPPDDSIRRLADLSDPELLTEQAQLRNTMAGLQTQLRNVNSEVERRERSWTL